MYNSHRNFNDKFKRVIERVADNIKTQQNRSNTIGRNKLPNLNRVSRATPIQPVLADDDTDLDTEEESQE